MFTGLVEDVGTLAWVEASGRGRRLGIRTALPLGEVAVGDSIATDGVCLTAEGFDGDVFTAVAGRETLERSTLATARPGRRVHLERALALGDRLGGHLVQGHVDGLGEVARSFDAQESWILWIRLPEELSRYVASKGSLCVDGVSLTVNEVSGHDARLNIVPHTARATRLGRLRPGEQVNLEVDVLAKYVERLLGACPSSDQGAPSGLTAERLRSLGYEP